MEVVGIKDKLNSGIDSFSIDHIKCSKIPTFIGSNELSKDGLGETVDRPKGDLFNERDYELYFSKSLAIQRYELY